MKKIGFRLLSQKKSSLKRNIHGLLWKIDC
jgi:hypothetical protein